MELVKFIASGIVFSLLPIKAIALEMEYRPAWKSNGKGQPATIFMHGAVERRDGSKLRALIHAHPDVEIIVIGDSPGGSLHGGISVGEIVYENGLDVRVNGTTGSAATLISLSARNQVYYFSQAVDPSYGFNLLFHCAYTSRDECNSEGTMQSAQMLEKFTLRSANEWFDLMMSTTPTTFIEIPLGDILVYDNWNCVDFSRELVRCSR